VAQLVHCELVALVQVSGTTHWGIGVHAGQVSAPLGRADVSR
jgi:hypothetical protein